MTKYSIVVPVYNSEKTLSELHERVKKVFTDVVGADYELILVDDSSKDGSFEEMKRIHSLDEKVKVFQLAKNFGQHNALMCGFAQATGDYVVTIDDDLQHPPEEIPKLIEAMRADPEVDVAIGKYDSKKHGPIRNFGSRVINKIAMDTNEKTENLDMTSFRLMKKYVVDYIVNIKIDTPRIGYLIMAITDRIINVTVHHDERKYGSSQYSFKRLVRDFKLEVMSNTVLPLKLVKYVGGISCLASLVLMIVYLIEYITGSIEVLGWTTIIVLMLLFFGITLMSIGIIGEYLMRIIGESKKIPNYFIRKN